MKTLINPWKGLKHFAADAHQPLNQGENPNKSLEGIKTSITLYNAYANNTGENPNKSLEGIKTHRPADAL